MTCFCRQTLPSQVSLGYLLSLDFEQLATQRTGKENPSFVDMKTGFWLSDDPIGAKIICPRDGRPGCALVDWIPCHDRKEQTHFLSWTWKYTLAEVASALKMFEQSMEDRHAASGVFFFMCFFANNQFRIIVEESSTGSDNLESVFEGNLRRVGRMVAVLDTWDRPLYLSRIWTVYEQFVASALQIQAGKGGWEISVCEFDSPSLTNSLFKLRFLRRDLGSKQPLLRCNSSCPRPPEVFCNSR